MRTLPPPCKKAEIKMKITYLGHSGFAVETEKFNFVFDYYTGEIPELSQKKDTFVFVSHNHYDHMNPDVFNLCRSMKNVRFVLSSDIPDSLPQRFGVRDYISASPGRSLRFETRGGRMRVKTLYSTDAGVAFLVITERETIFHAGDLNLWLWDGMTESEVYDMTNAYRQYTAPLRNYTIDVAFLTLDTRQEQYAFLNIDYYMRHFNIKNCIPMHYFGSTKICDALKDSDISIDYRDRIVKLKPFRYVNL